ncbi:hypothetical protein J6590_016759 [Homalodisca vitripennis]|nr:hypothetical protein J6590_016759 [Homalodisca vitripennis]
MTYDVVQQSATQLGHVVQDVLGDQDQDDRGRINDAVGWFTTQSDSCEISHPKDFVSEILDDSDRINNAVGRFTSQSISREFSLP